MKIASHRSPNQVAVAKRLLASEGLQPDASPDERAAAAARVYEKIQAYWIPIIGSAGVQALFQRSASLERSEFPWLAEAGATESAEKLRDRLLAQDAATAADAAESFFATFFTLVATFIGAPLTEQLQRSAWPALNDGTNKESGK